MHFQKFYVIKICPKQTDLSVLINEASKEFSQVTHLENFLKIMLKTLKYLVDKRLQIGVTWQLSCFGISKNKDKQIYLWLK